MDDLERSLQELSFEGSFIMYLLFTDFIFLLFGRISCMNLVSLLEYTHTVPLDGQAYQFHQARQFLPLHL